MKILALDTSAVAASAAILSDGKLLSEAYINTGLNHSETVMVLIDNVLKQSSLTLDDIDYYAVTAGPGSFTGIRIGVSAIKGLVFFDNKKCFSVSTPEAIAYSAAIDGFIICPVMDARCMQVYSAAFEKRGDDLIRLFDDAPLKLEELAMKLKEYDKKILLAGDGADIAYKYLSEKGFDVRKMPEIFKYQHASSVAFCAWNMYNNGIGPEIGSALVPVYLRLSQAERELKNRSNKNDSIKQ